VGRDRWLKLADLLPKDHQQRAVDAAQSDTSDDWFEAVLTDLTSRKHSAPRDAVPLKGIDGAVLGQMRRSGTKEALTLNTKTAQGFEDWLNREYLRASSPLANHPR